MRSEEVQGQLSTARRAPRGALRGAVGVHVRMSVMLLAGVFAGAAGAEGPAEAGWYVEGHIGQADFATGEGTDRDPDGGANGEPTTTRFTASYADGDSFDLIVGHTFELGRFEVEYTQVESSIEEPAVSHMGSRDISSQAALLNVWFAFGQSWKVQPYFGGGVGGVRHSLGDSESSGAAAQLGAGLEWLVRPRWALNLSYRLLQSEAIELKRDDRDVVATHRGNIVSLGVRYEFFRRTTPSASSEPVTVVPAETPSSPADDVGATDGSQAPSESPAPTSDPGEGSSTGPVDQSTN